MVSETLQEVLARCAGIEAIPDVREDFQVNMPEASMPEPSEPSEPSEPPRDWAALRKARPAHEIVFETLASASRDFTEIAGASNQPWFKQYCIYLNSVICWAFLRLAGFTQAQPTPEVGDQAQPTPEGGTQAQFSADAHPETEIAPAAADVYWAALEAKYPDIGKGVKERVLLELLIKRQDYERTAVMAHQFGLKHLAKDAEDSAGLFTAALAHLGYKER
jgi:hypothetical protein